jgi:hypothetical protein
MTTSKSVLLVSGVSFRALGKGSNFEDPEMSEHETPNKKNVLAEANTKLSEVIRDGLRHGFFECSVTCELIKDRKRRLIIRAGKNHQFIIREEELSD